MMSSRRKSTTPCMVLPSDVVDPEEAEEKTDRTKEVEHVDGKEGTVKEVVEEVPPVEELGQAVVVVPTPPDTGKAHPLFFAITNDKRPSMNITWRCLGKYLL